MNGDDSSAVPDATLVREDTGGQAPPAGAPRLVPIVSERRPDRGGRGAGDDA